jgi:hypothetical protein
LAQAECPHSPPGNSRREPRAALQAFGIPIPAQRGNKKEQICDLAHRCFARAKANILLQMSAHEARPSMQRRNLIVLVGAWTCAIGLMLAAFPGSSVNADQPPRPGCVAVVKQEYDSAKRQNLLQNRFSSYATTGQLGRRSYWYCRS